MERHLRLVAIITAALALSGASLAAAGSAAADPGNGKGNGNGAGQAGPGPQAQGNGNGKPDRVPPGQAKHQPPQPAAQQEASSQPRQAEPKPSPGHTPYANHGGQQQGAKYPTPNGGRGIPGCGPSNSQPKKCRPKPSVAPPPAPTPEQPPQQGSQPTPQQRPQQSQQQPQQSPQQLTADQQGAGGGQQLAAGERGSVVGGLVQSRRHAAAGQARRALPEGLPFTGLSLFLLLAGGVALAAGGFALRTALAGDGAWSSSPSLPKPRG